MNHEGMQGATFGIMDGVINILGVLWGLSVTNNNFIIIIGLLTAGLANSFGNSAGVHVSQETELHHKKKEVWKSTILSFLASFFVAIIFSLPFFIFTIFTSIVIDVIFALILLMSIGYFVAKLREKKPISIILEYTFMGIIVSIICFSLGNFVNWLF